MAPSVSQQPSAQAAEPLAHDLRGQGRTTQRRHPFQALVPCAATLLLLPFFLLGWSEWMHPARSEADPLLEAGEASISWRSMPLTSVSRVALLVLTHNHGEACEISTDRRKALAAYMRSQIEILPLPQVLMMSSQELRADGWFPLVEAIQGLPYELIGISDISGRTKMFCSKVQTAVQVAVHTDVVEQVRAAVAEHCGPLSGVCTEAQSAVTKERFYTWPVKQTKGHVAVQLQIGAVRLSLLSAHLDTRDNDDNLRKRLGPAIGRWSAVPGVSVLAADFNNRIRASAASKLCGQLSPDSLATIFNATSPTFRHDMRLTELEAALLQGVRLSGGGGDRLSVAMAQPATQNGMALPTYKFPTLQNDLLPDAVRHQAPMLFGADGSKVCHKEPPSIGVLDSVAWVHDPGQFGVSQVAQPIWAMMPGSDHAIVGARLHIEQV